MSKRRGKRAACCGGLGQLLSPRVFKALGDSRRIALLVRLAEAGGPCTVGDLAQGSSVDLSVVSRHLAVLREAGIIRCDRRGKEVLCSLEAGAVAAMLRALADAFDASRPPAAPRANAAKAAASRR